jgi:MFS family permease
MFRIANIPKGQIPSLIALHFFVGFVFWYGIEKIFLSSQLHVGPTGIVAIVTLYTVVTLVLDVPASVIADIWGRRRMLVVAIVCFIIANLILGSSHDFTMYLVGTIFWGLFTVSYEGTYEAILFDSLKQEKREKQFQKIDAWSRLFFMIGIAISSMTSGFIADWLGLRSVYFISVIPFIFALGILLFAIREPKLIHEDQETEDIIRRGYFSHLTHAFKFVWKSSVLRLVMFGTIIMFFIQTPLYEFIQYVYIELFHTPLLVGLFGGIGCLFLALGFFIAIKRKHMFNMRFLLLLTGAAIAIIALLSNIGSLLPLAFVFITVSIIENALQTELQHATTSRMRASVTSAVYFAGNILIVPFIFLFGLIAEHGSIWTAYAIDGGVVLIMALGYVLVIFLQKPKGMVATTFDN